jgi:hypothetical protein
MEELFGGRTKDRPQTSLLGAGLLSAICHLLWGMLLKKGKNAAQ